MKILALILVGLLVVNAKDEKKKEGKKEEAEPKPEVLSTMGEMTYDVILEPVDRYILPLMPFWYEELDPYVTDPMLTAHHMGEHNVHKSYMNRELRIWREEEPDNEFNRESILTIIQNLDKVPEKYRTVLRNHGGGFVNHCFYFGILSPNEDEVERLPTGKILEDIEAAFTSFEEFKKQFQDAANKLFGSGYVWLTRAPGGAPPNLAIQTTANQDSPVMAGLQPILVLDLWEHAYYLKNDYKRWEHYKDFWMVVDWSYVEKLDNWWLNIEEEQLKADKRVQETKDYIAEQARKKEAKEGEKKEEKKEEL